MSLKYHLILDDDYGKQEKRAKLDAIELLAKDQLGEILSVDTPDEADVLLVGGGDGFLFRSIRKYYSHKKPFFGVNAGTAGFLLNHLDEIKTLPSSLDQIKTYDIPIVPVEITNKRGEKKSGIYVNDMQIGRLIKSYAKFNITGEKDNEGEEREKVVKGTMLLMNTPLGSTGYGLGLRQPPLPFTDSIRGILGMACGSFRNMSVDPQHITIDVSSRDQMDIYLDGEADEHYDISSVSVSPPTQNAQLAFLLETDFEKRRHIAYEKHLKSR